MCDALSQIQCAYNALPDRMRLDELFLCARVYLHGFLLRLARSYKYKNEHVICRGIDDPDLMVEEFVNDKIVRDDALRGFEGRSKIEAYIRRVFYYWFIDQHFTDRERLALDEEIDADQRIAETDATDNVLITHDLLKSGLGRLMVDDPLGAKLITQIDLWEHSYRELIEMREFMPEHVLTTYGRVEKYNDDHGEIRFIDSKTRAHLDDAGMKKRTIDYLKKRHERAMRKLTSICRELEL